MGLLGRLTGWDQQKAAHNAVLAHYLSEAASPELRREIVGRLVLIQQQVRGGAGDPHAIVADLSQQPRIVQMNFIALACNSIGIPPVLPGLSFAAVENPYHAENESSLSRIGVALDDISRRSGRPMHWPGNHERIDFLSWGGLQRPGASESEAEATPSRPNAEYAAHLAYRNLLAEAIDFGAIHGLAKELAGVIDAGSDKELALATALFFFEQEELNEVLRPVQMTARLTMVNWMQEGTVQARAARHFEEQLYRLYKP